MKPFNLSSRLFTTVFWQGILQNTDQWRSELAALSDALKRLDDLRTAADYNTGSISNSAAWCLYSLARYFQPLHVIEIGTFIGKSTWALAQGMDDHQGGPGDIFTCDLSNNIKVPWTGKTKLVQFPKTSSTEMLKRLSGIHDLCFLDGRVGDEDLKRLDSLIDQNTIIVLDDFEGMEKGVANLMKLKALPKLAHHFLINPASENYLQELGFTSHSTVAVMLPLSRVALSNQG